MVSIADKINFCFGNMSHLCIMFLNRTHSQYFLLLHSLLFERMFEKFTLDMSEWHIQFLLNGLVLPDKLETSGSWPRQFIYNSMYRKQLNMKRNKKSWQTIVQVWSAF